MSQERRIKILYRKYINRSSTDAELEELFELMRHSGEFDSIRAELKQKWDDPEVVEELASLD